MNIILKNHWGFWKNLFRTIGFAIHFMGIWVFDVDIDFKGKSFYITLLNFSLQIYLGKKEEK